MLHRRRDFIISRRHPHAIEKLFPYNPRTLPEVRTLSESRYENRTCTLSPSIELRSVWLPCGSDGSLAVLLCSPDRIERLLGRLSGDNKGRLAFKLFLKIGRTARFQHLERYLSERNRRNLAIRIFKGEGPSDRFKHPENSLDDESKANMAYRVFEYQGAT